MESTAKRINDMLTGIGNVRAERAGDLILIVGSTTKNNMSRIDAVAKLYPTVVHNVVRDEELMMKRMVYFRVQIIEMKKSLSESLGVKWDSSISGPAAATAVNFNDQANFRYPNTPPTGFPTAIPPTGFGWRPYLGLTSAITSMINLAVNNGDAFVLASPELSSRSGGKAEFLAGGQIPIVSPASGTQPASVSFKDYGIKLSIEPVADEKNNISTSLKTEVSSIDYSVSISGNPGFLTRKTDSEFNVQSGQTIVLSGLVNKELQRDVSKLPQLGDLPVLGSLFRSTNFKSGRTDMVILVTPYVIESDLSIGINKEMVDKAREIENKANSTAAAKGILN
jgi:pilus assembly protein CpaC